MSFPNPNHHLCRGCDEVVDIMHDCKGTLDHYKKKRNMEVKMSSIKEEALAYEAPQTLNIADLDSVSVELSVQEKESKNSEGEPFSYKYTIVDGKEYRIPNSVFEEIKTILTLKPSVTKVRVNKSGSGLGTRYKVEALD
jgi:hypothetical protein|tara:strand:+ start:5461 stop:5877 length:417 start_codon:yes stop_codon:yes gene_type:complete